MVTTQDRIRFAAMMINEGKIDNLQSLYKNLTKKVVAEILGVNHTRFSNLKSNHPGDFKIDDVKKLSSAFNIDMPTMVKLFDNSLSAQENQPA